MSGTTWTVTRGAEGTTPVTHTAGFTIYQVATATDLTSFPQWVNPRAYGAKGDGSTDDTTAFASARDAAGTGGRVDVPGGTYILSNLALNVAGQTWRLAPGATLKLKAAANGPIFSISVAGVTVTGGGVIDGNYAAQTTTFHTLCIVDGASATDVTFDGVTVQNANGYGLAAGTNATNVSGFTVQNCTFKSTQFEALVVGSTGISSDITDVAFINNKVYNYSSSLLGGGLGVTMIGHPGTAHVRRVTATGNRIECWPIGTTEPVYVNWSGGIHFSGVIDGTISGNAIFGCTLGVTIPNCQEIAVTGNSLEGYSGYGIEVPCPSAALNTTSITVQANTIVDTDPRGGAGYHSEYCISLSAAAGATRYVTVAGNVITQVTTSGFPSVGIGGGGMTVDHVIVSGNTISKSSGGGCVFFHSVTDAKLADNVIDCNANNNNPIWFDSGGGGGTFVAGWSATGNIIGNYTSSGTGLVYGNGTENMTYVVFTGNLFPNGGVGTAIGAASSGVLASPFLNTNNVGP